VNSSLTALAGWLERRTRRGGRAPKAAGLPVPAGTLPTGEAAGAL